MARRCDPTPVSDPACYLYLGEHTCPACEGVGYLFAEPEAPCEVCDGSGVVDPEE